jgi:hypothetical protein
VEENRDTIGLTYGRASIVPRAFDALCQKETYQSASAPESMEVVRIFTMGCPKAVISSMMSNAGVLRTMRVLRVRRGSDSIL